jgi:hypothetical protein
LVSASVSNAIFLGAMALILVILVFALGLFAGSIVVRSRLVARERRIEMLLEKWRRIFFDDEAGEAAAEPLGRNDEFVILNLWNRLHEDGAGKQSAQEWTRLAQVGRRLGFAQIATAILRRGDTSDRIVALTTLGYLEERGALGAARVLTRHRDGGLSFAAYRAVVSIEPGELTSFLREAARKPDWPIVDVERFLRVLPPERTVAAIRAAADGAGRMEVVALLRYLPACESPEARIAAREILQAAADPEVVTAALRAMRELGEPGDRPVLRRFLDVGQPEFVRLAALNALLPHCEAADRDRLVSLLGDPAYWIRYRAAQALTCLPGGPADAAQLAESLADPYSRDMLKHVLAEREWDASPAVRSQQQDRDASSSLWDRLHHADALRIKK